MLQTLKHLAKRELASGLRTLRRAVIAHSAYARTNKQRSRRIAAPLTSRSWRSAAAARVLNLERSALQAPPHAIA